MASPISPQAQRILDCAQALIATGGYNGFSYADISARIGITKASIHHHFPRKEGLVLTLVQQYRNAAEAGMTAVSANGGEPLACLQAYVGWWSGCIADASMPICLCAMLAAELPVLPAPVADEVQRHFQGLAAWLEALLSAGATSGALHLQSGPAAEAQAFMATVHGAMIAARTYRDPRMFDLVTGPLLSRLIAPQSGTRAPAGTG